MEVAANKSSVEYRPEIDGLRAVAVLSVIIFHLKHRWLPGGFVGVDIFFVISGYLITSILLRECEKGSFSFAKFYQRRIARLFPAFFIVAFATIFGALFIYSPQDLASSGANLTATVLSVANMKYLFQGNYFTISPDAQPFLHYWSLSVEEQFYMCFPAFYFFFVRRIKQHTTAVFVVCFVISLLACIFLTRSKPVFAFYILPTRAWELLAGSILANLRGYSLIEHFQKAWGIIATAGLGIICASVLMLHDNASFPGYIAVLPVLGAACFIGPGKGPKGMAATLLSCKPIVIIGRMSYSLYLWHWPIFSLVDYKLYLATPLERLCLKIGLTLASSAACFLLIESPGRVYLNRPDNRRLAFAFLACAIFVSVLLGVWIRNQNYLNADMKDVANGGLIYNNNITTASMILMGDSHGAMYGKMARQIANTLGYKLTIISAAAENPLPNPGGQDPLLWTQSIAIAKKQRPDVLLLVCNWRAKISDNPARLRCAVDELKQDCGSLILITQPPQLPPSASRESMRDGSRPPFFEDPVIRADRMAINRFVMSLASGNVHVIDIEHHFESQNGELIISDAGGRQYYHDETHLSGLGADLVREDLVELMNHLKTARRRPAATLGAG